MSLIGKKPFLYEVFEKLSTANLTDLQELVDNLGNPTTVDFYKTGIPVALKGVHYVTVKLEEFKVVYGFLCYTDNICGLFTWQDALESMNSIRLNPTNKTFAYLQEHLTAEEFRRAIDDYIEVKAGGDVTPGKLASLMKGNNIISVDLSEDNKKVVTAIDMTDAEKNTVSVIATSDAENATWETLNSLLNVDDDSLGKFLHLGSSGLNWSTPTVDHSTVETVGVSFTNVGGVYTSNDNLTRNIHLFAELSMEGTHAHIGMDMNVYDSSISYSVARVNWGGTMVDVAGYINSDGAIVLDLSALTGLERVEARYFYYA